jgi:recombination DNA repair RAD52 pathway protein
MSEETAQSPMEWYEHEKKRDQERERDRLAKNKALFNELTEPFPPEMERSVVKSGTSLTYIPVSEVITRLNRTFGVCGWSYEIIKCERDIVDLGDEFKGAISDALKKAAQHFGVGLYLARDTEAIEIDEAMHSEPQPVDPVVDKYNRFKEIRDMLTKEQLAELREYWNTWSGGRPVPKPSEFTVKELEIMTVEALRLNLGGTVSHDFESDDQ